MPSKLISLDILKLSSFIGEAPTAEKVFVPAENVLFVKACQDQVRYPGASEVMLHGHADQNGNPVTYVTNENSESLVERVNTSLLKG